MTENAIIYLGPPEYMYEAYICAAFAIALMNAIAAARFAGGREMVFDIQARIMTRRSRSKC